LDVGYVWGLFHSLVPKVIETFRQKHPDVSVNLFDLPATGQAKALVEGRLDLGFIGFAQEADDAKLAKARIGSCSFVAALPEKHPAARKAKVELERLAADFFFVISEESFPGAAGFVTAACAHAGFRPKVLQTAERGHTILGLVAGNCGVAILPEPLRALPHPGVLFRPLAQPITADLFVAWKPGNDSELVTALRESAIGQAEKH
jgi:DNA-binding transcriptional LysR family regulator